VRIAQIAAPYHPRIGGAEKNVLNIAHGYAKAGDHAIVLTHHVDASLVDERIHTIPTRRFLLTVSSRTYPLSLSLFRRLRSNAPDFDLIHVHSYRALVGLAAIGCTSITLSEPAALAVEFAQPSRPVHFTGRKRSA
jgi:glycosyltransferase involved in cell wall biosynthesis